MRIEVDAAVRCGHGSPAPTRPRWLMRRSHAPVDRRRSDPRAGRARRSARWAGGGFALRRLRAGEPRRTAVCRRATSTEGMKPLCAWVQASVALHLGADGLPVVVVEHQAVECSWRGIRRCRRSRVSGEKSFRPTATDVESALVDVHDLRPGRGCACSSRDRSRAFQRTVRWSSPGPCSGSRRWAPSRACCSTRRRRPCPCCD